MNIHTAFGVSSSFIRRPSNKNRNEWTGTPYKTTRELTAILQVQDSLQDVASPTKEHSHAKQICGKYLYYVHQILLQVLQVFCADLKNLHDVHNSADLPPPSKKSVHFRIIWMYKLFPGPISEHPPSMCRNPAKTWTFGYVNLYMHLNAPLS